MKITIISVGKIKENYFTMAIEEYVKRLSRYCKLELVEVTDEKTPDQASEAQENQIKNLEGDRILKYVKDGTYLIALAIEGKMLSSIELAEKIEQLGVNGSSHITLVIGGSLGLSREVLNRADSHLSFSRMTFPHQMMKVILLEQIYRAYRINTNQPYHK